MERAKLATAVAVLSLAASIILPLSAKDDNDDDHRNNSRVETGFRIAPVPLDTRGKNQAQVGLGSYLVNAVASCNDCHTWPNYSPGGNPFQGQPEQVNVNKYLAGGRAFPTPFGTFISKNITPDASGRPAGLTRSEFVSVLRTGHDPDTGKLLQVMPWPVFSHMSDHDINAIYEYLSSVPSLPNNY